MVAEIQAEIVANVPNVLVGAGGIVTKAAVAREGDLIAVVE